MYSNKTWYLTFVSDSQPINGRRSQISSRMLYDIIHLGARDFILRYGGRTLDLRKSIFIPLSLINV